MIAVALLALQVNHLGGSASAQRTQSGTEASEPLLCAPLCPLCPPWFASTLRPTTQAKEWVEYKGRSGAGKGKHIIFLSGDEEYRSEEGLPQLARILAFRHGFRCTVLFSVDPQGFIDPKTKNNEPGIEALDSADLCVMLLRFREWPDAQMKHFMDYVVRGKPIIALRTSTHAFDYAADSNSQYRKFSWNSPDWPGGFGKQILGETWISHWGNHGVEATRGVVRVSAKASPMFRGVNGLFGTTDVYEAHPPQAASVLVDGEVVNGLNPGDRPATYRKKTSLGVEQAVNEPMMPIVWTRDVRNEFGTTNRVLTCTMGAATDLLDEGLRRMLVNATYWAAGLENRIPRKANVSFLGKYQPSPFGFDKFKSGVRPADLDYRGG